jgi:hypothetical protein
MGIKRIYKFWFSFLLTFFYFYAEANGVSHWKEKENQVKIYDACCQSMNNPAGIDVEPYFSWKISSKKHGIFQKAYQVIVATDPEKLNEKADVWNSGMVVSGRNTFVHYSGIPLRSGRKYYWKVKVWITHKSAIFCSKTSYFITGITTKKEWTASKWIAFEKLDDSMRVYPGVAGKGNGLGDLAVKRAVIPCFRKELEVKKDISDAYVFICGLGQYVFSVNGTKVGQSFLSPAWSDYSKRCYYNTYDVSALLVKGFNTIGAIVGTGFLYVNRERYRKMVIAQGYPMLRMQMIIRYTDGSYDKIGTDSSWKTTNSAITYSSIYGGEDFDANKEIYGWQKPDFNDVGWKKVIVVSGPAGEMEAQKNYSVHINQVFAPERRDTINLKRFVFDFGQNISGIIRLEVVGKKGYRVRITPSEILKDENVPDQRGSGSPYYWNYILNGKGKEIWQPMFSYYGFRYATLEVFNREGDQVKISDGIASLSLLSLHTQNASPDVGDFNCSDTLFNKIYSLIKWGIRNNLSNISTDCPHREKLGWLEQSYLMANSVCYNYDFNSFGQKIIQDMEDAQLTSGLVPDIAPEYVIFQGGFRDSPEWGSACVLLPWYLYRWYGDKEILAKSFEMMTRYVDDLEGKSRGHLLDYGLGDWFDIGVNSPGVSQLTPLGLTASAYFYYDAIILSKVANLLQKPLLVQKYTLLSDSIREAFNEKYFNPTRKVYGTGSQTSFAVPLYFGMVDSSFHKEVFQNFIKTIKDNQMHLTAGDIGLRYVIQSLEQGGESRMIYEMNHDDSSPGYGYQLRQGATSLTESWAALKNVSNDHMMLGELMEWFYGGLAGISQQNGSVGYRKIMIAPQFDKRIDHVNSYYNSINGPVRVCWRRKRRRKVRIKVQIPANSTARIYLPSARVKGRNKGLENHFVERSKVPNKFSQGTEIDLASGEYKFRFTQMQ